MGIAFRHLKKVISLSLLVLLAMTSEADAAAATTLGGVLGNAKDAFSTIPNLLTSVAYISGLFYAVQGVLKFKDHVDSPSQHPLSAGVKRFIAGGLLLALPFTSQALYGSIFGGADPANVLSSSGRHDAPAEAGMDKMIYDLIANIAGPSEALLVAFAWISGLALLIVGINRLTKTAQEGPRGPTGLGTIMTFIASGALFSFGSTMAVFSTSLFGDAQVTTYADIAESVLKKEDAVKIYPVLEALMTFIMIVGYIAMMRGIFVLKAFADGGGNATLAQALTFLFGGALAINMGPLVNVLQETVGLSGVTFGLPS